jgi:hypothetical protein
MRSSNLLAGVVAIGGVAAVASSQIVIDGAWDKAYGPPLVVQDNQTGFGDSNLGLIDFANGSELDAAFATVIDGTLFLLLAGNLESNFNKLEIFIDCREGGQNVLRGDNADVNFNGLNRMGTLASDPTGSPGLTFDAEFAADYFITTSGGGDPYTMYLDWAELPTLGGGAGQYAGSGSAGVENTGENGIRFSINNANVAGVDGGDGLVPGGGEGVLTGIEFAIPLEAIGYDGGALRVCAFINGSGHDFLANQVLGGLGGLPNLGEPRLVNFAVLPGDQFFTVIDGDSGPFCGDANAGDCCSGGDTPYCDNAICCAAVCALDPSCCSKAWDAACADLAGTVCVACGGVETCGGSSEDCNGNGLSDGCDIAFGVSLDCNLNGVPDECEREVPFCVDGLWSEEYGAALAIQDTQTNFGNSDTAAIDFANGSEADAAFAFVADGFLHLLIAGNLEANYNKLEVFIDSGAGGQNQLRGDNADVDFNGLNRMGPDPANPKAGPGLRFDQGFTANYWIALAGGPGGAGYDLYLNFADLPTKGGGSGGFAGPGDAGRPTLAPNGILFSIDNSNIAGVDGGTELVPGGGDGVFTGMELRIPLDVIGWTGGPIKVCAFVNASNHSFVSNQVLGGIGGGDNLGDPRFVDFAAIPGLQYFAIDAGGTPCPGDFDGNGAVDGADLGGLLQNWGSKNAAFDITGDGLVNGADLGALLQNWGSCG